MGLVGIQLHNERGRLPRLWRRSVIDAHPCQWRRVEAAPSRTIPRAPRGDVWVGFDVVALTVQLVRNWVRQVPRLGLRCLRRGYLETKDDGLRVGCWGNGAGQRGRWVGAGATGVALPPPCLGTAIWQRSGRGRGWN